MQISDGLKEVEADLVAEEAQTQKRRKKRNEKSEGKLIRKGFVKTLIEQGAKLGEVDNSGRKAVK